MQENGEETKMSEKNDLTLEQIIELMKIIEHDPLAYQRLQRIFRNKEYLENQKKIERFFKLNRKKHEHLIFVTPNPGFHSRVSTIIRDLGLKDLGS